MFIYPYRTGSQSVRALKNGLGAKLIRLEGSKFLGGKGKNLINWGNTTDFVELEKCNYLNLPQSVRMASNKRQFFELVGDFVSTPPWTTDRLVAYSWITENKRTVVVRETLAGHSGEGIVLLDNEDDWDAYDHGRAKLYTQYVPKKHEFRVHVFRGKAFDVQRKAASSDRLIEDYRIRNSHAGFIYVRNEDQSWYPKEIYEQAEETFSHLPLDFGAVDIIYNEYRKQAYVLEVNTAPGLEGTTLDNYLEQFGNFFQVAVTKEEPADKASPSAEAAAEAMERAGLHAEARRIRQTSIRLRGPRLQATNDGWGNATWATNATPFYELPEAEEEVDDQF